MHNRDIKRFAGRRPHPLLSTPSCPRRGAALRGFAVAAALWLWAGCAFAGDVQNPFGGYHLGRGLYLPNEHLTLGGYLSMHMHHFDGEPTRFALRDLSLFATWTPTPRWQVFTEMEIGDALTAKSGEISTSAAEFDVERLYADYTVRPWLTLRFGKFLTPVGEWNQIHADPLVWTVSRPLVSSVPFARHASGLAVHGSVDLAGNDLDYMVYADDSEQLDPDRSELAFEGAVDTTLQNVFRNAAGLHLRYHLWGDKLQLGASYVNFRMRASAERKDLFGLDAKWAWHGYELSSEAIYRHSEGGAEPPEWGAFIQGVAPLFGHLYAVGRYEYFRGSALLLHARIGTLGLAYRPSAPVVMKLEYRTGADINALVPDGWLASFSVLF